MTSETVNLKVSLTNWLEQLIMLDCNNGLMSRLLMSLTLLYKKVEVLENEVIGLISTLVQIYRTIKHHTAQLQSSLEHQITILNRRYRWEFVFNISINANCGHSIFKFNNMVQCMVLTCHNNLWFLHCRWLTTSLKGGFNNIIMAFDRHNN